MRSSNVRHVINLRLSLVGAASDIHREIAIDRDLTLADLRSVVQVLFDRPRCRHHLFTDLTDGPTWSRRRRRWGNRWTMIDFRDPTVVDDSTARIGKVMNGTTQIYFAHTCDDGWVVEIEVGPDDVVAASEPAVRVLGGDGRSPFACSRGPYEHDVLVGVWNDATDPDHEKLRSVVSATVGPWSRFDPASFDVRAAQKDLQTHPAGGPQPAHGPLELLLSQLPETARPGLRTHLATTGLGLPSVVTMEEADALTRPFGWLIAHTGSSGVPLVDGVADPAAVQLGAASLGCSEDDVRRLYAAARQLGLVYSRNRRLVAKKTVIAAAQSPTTLWFALAESVAAAPIPHSPPVARILLLLSIADGSLADPHVGLRRAAHAYALVGGSSSRGASWYGSSSRGSSWRGEYPAWSDDPYRDPYRDDECDHHCDCPSVNGVTWHQVVAQSVRDAVAAASSDGAVAFAAYEDSEFGREARMPREWWDFRGDSSMFGGSDAFGGPAMFGGSGMFRGSAAGSKESLDPESALLSAVAGVIDLLALFGLARADDGAWIVPPTLQEFARAALQG